MAINSINIFITSNCILEVVYCDLDAVNGNLGPVNCNLGAMKKTANYWEYV